MVGFQFCFVRSGRGDKLRVEVDMNLTLKILMTKRNNHLVVTITTAEQQRQIIFVAAQYL